MEASYYIEKTICPEGQTRGKGVSITCIKEETN